MVHYHHGRETPAGDVALAPEGYPQASRAWYEVIRMICDDHDRAAAAAGPTGPSPSRDAAFDVAFTAALFRDQPGQVVVVGADAVRMAYLVGACRDPSHAVTS